MMNAWSNRSAQLVARLLIRTSIAIVVLRLGGIFSSNVNAASVTLAWDRAASHTNLAAFILKYGTRSGNYPEQVSVATNSTTKTVNSLVAGMTYYFVVTAKNVANLESDSSNEISYTVPGTRANATPIATSISTNTAEDQPKSIKLTGTDADGDSLTFSIVTSPHKGTLSGTPPNVTYRPNSNYFGSDSFTFRANDGHTNSAAATVSISVTAVNDAPTISPIANQSVERDTPTIAIPFVVDDLETQANSLTLAATSSDQSLIPNSNIELAGSGANRTITANPTDNKSGVATITVFVSDGNLGSSTTFQLTVRGENTAPVIVAASSIATESYTEADVPVVVTDRESPPGDLILAAASMNTSVLPNLNISFSGGGSNRVMKCRPVPGKSGTVVVNLSVSDGRAITRRALQLNVQTGTAPTSRLSILLNGRGSVKPALDGEILTIGKTYSISAIPASDEVFLHWNRGATSSLPKITFTMTSNLVLEATFTNNPFMERKGLYNGLFYETAEVRDGSSGSITLTPTDRGTYSGKLRIGKYSYPISGSQDLALRATNIIARRGTTDLVAELDFGSRSNQVVGHLTDGNWTADIIADRALYNANDNACPFAGKYTIIFPGLVQPEGDGFGTIKVDGNGLASLAGTLADGTKTSCKSSLSRLGQWPVYCVTSAGTVLSWMTFAERPTDDLTGVVSWIKPTQLNAKYYPGGLTNEIFAVGSSFVQPTDLNSTLVDLSETTVSFTGGNVTPSFSNDISWGMKDKITNLSENKLALSINSSSGLFKGSVTDPGTLKTSKFAGALLQKRNYGSGFMLGTDRSALVVIGERPAD